VRWAPFVLLVVALVALPAFGAEAPRPDAAQQQSGAQLYGQHCAFCHGSLGEGTYRGPTLDEAGAAGVHFMLSTGRMPITAPDEPVRRGPPVFDDDAIARLVDYVTTLTDGPDIPSVDVDAGDVAKGGELYRLSCAACHGWAGGGAILLHSQAAPPLHESTPTQVAEAMLLGPGTMPVFGPDTFTDEEVDAIAAYVQYLEDPRDVGGLPLAHIGPIAEGAVALLVVLPLLLVVAAWIGKRA
jgi:ubiquinol-cytochrome c reductase cytochrome c subunit